MDEFFSTGRTFEEGAAEMKARCARGADSFEIGPYRVHYPGYKKNGDYRLEVDGKAPTHTDIVEQIADTTDEHNHKAFVNFLDHIYEYGTSNGLRTFVEQNEGLHPLIDIGFAHLLYWITLQEDINYPPPAKQGHRLPFCRFYEATLVHTGLVSLGTVKQRTNNHGGRVPSLLTVDSNSHKPGYY